MAKATAKKSAPRKRATPKRPKTDEQPQAELRGPDEADVIGPAHEIETEPAMPTPILGGPKTGYRDGDGVVESCTFMDGKVPDGWHASPAGCTLDYRKDGMVTVTHDAAHNR